MSKKIFGVVLLLSLVTIAITGVAIYGIGNIRASTESLALAAERATSLTRVNRVNWQRTAATLRTIIYTDPAAVDAIVNGDFPSLEKEFAAELQVQRDATTAAEPDDVRRRPDELQKLWAPFAAASTEVAAMARLNTNATALQVIEKECNPLRMKEAQLFTTTLSDLPGIESISVPMQTVPTDVRELVISTDDAQMKQIRDRINATARQVDDAIASMKIDARYSADWKTLVDTWTQHKAVANRIADLSQQNTNARAMELFEQKLTPAQTAMVSFTSSASAAARATRDSVQQDATALGQRVTWVTLVVAGVGIVVALALAWFIVSRIVRNLNHIVDNLGEASNQVASAAHMISESSQGLAEGATEQAASLEETSSALEEMASMTRQNADNATRTSTSTAHTVQLIDEGAKAVGNMTGAMSEITDSAEKISQIIKTIEEIAFQTNLLALNAAVEAARAGEAGKGFAVVADEVRNLAQRSAGAARDTATLIEGTVVRVRNGSEIASELDSSFKEINEGAREVGTLIGEITSATNEQAQGVDQVNTAVAQMDKVTQSNAASAEECASAAEELSGQAESLKGVVGDLVVLVSGKGGDVGFSAAPAAAPSRPAPRRASLPAPRRVAGEAPTSSRPQRQIESSSGQKVMKPNEVIPLDDEDGF